MIQKIISGGQTGADRAGIDAAIESGIDYGGGFPKAEKPKTVLFPRPTINQQRKAGRIGRQVMVYNDGLSRFMGRNAIIVWGVADLSGFETPTDETGQFFPCAIAWAIPMDPLVMTGIQEGPNQAYADEYTRVNAQINQLACDLFEEIRHRGFHSLPLEASRRTDPVAIKGDFPHKTAATRAGLGWIGKHCQLVTRPFGSWVRLGTVFTDMPLLFGRPVERSFCGNCRRCVDACPANALTGEPWYPHVSRDRILNAQSCDQWKKEQYYQFHQGHNCGICSAVCPFGLKTLKILSGLNF